MIQLFNWFRRGSLERGLDRELQYHFDRRVADITATGIPEPEARRCVAVEMHDRPSRTLRDFLLVRKQLAPSETGDPGPYEVPASCVPEAASTPTASPETPSSPRAKRTQRFFPLNKASQSAQSDPCSLTAPPPLLLVSFAPRIPPRILPSLTLPLDNFLHIL